MKSKKTSCFYRFICFSARWFFKLFYKLEVFGLEEYEKGRGIIVANHASYFDPPLLAITCPEEVHFLAKGALFHAPLIGSAIKSLNTHPLKGSAKDINTFKLVQQLLDEDQKVVLFPEGTRTLDDEIGPMKRGVGLIVSRAQTQIIPVYIHGSFKAWSRKKKIPRPFVHMACIYGKPIYWEEFAHLDPKEAQKELLSRISASLHLLKKWYLDGAKGPIP